MNTLLLTTLPFHFLFFSFLVLYYNRMAGKQEQDYVFVLDAEDKVSNTNFDTIEEVPNGIPFLPLDASTEITKHGGYTQAILTAQEMIDSRLDTYSVFAKLVKPTAVTGIQNRASGVKSNDRGLGWQKVDNVDQDTRNMLRDLQDEGVLYAPQERVYGVSYLSPVAPYGDCLFLSMEQLLLTSKDCENISPSKIRYEALQEFWQYYQSGSVEEKAKMDQTIKNLYFPDLKGGWGVSRIQTRRYVAAVDDRDILLARIYSMQDKGMSWDAAAQEIYAKHADPVVDAKSYCRYMNVGHTNASEAANVDFLVSLHFSAQGLMSVDNDPDDTRVAWGDDIVLESIASLYKRDIFVVLAGCGKMFFLPHRPRRLKDIGELKQPWFLLMRLNGSDRGGDHYEPMISTSMPDRFTSQLGSIGED